MSCSLSSRFSGSECPKNWWRLGLCPDHNGRAYSASRHHRSIYGRGPWNEQGKGEEKGGKMGRRGRKWGSGLVAMNNVLPIHVINKGSDENFTIESQPVLSTPAVVPACDPWSWYPRPTVTYIGQANNWPINAFKYEGGIMEHLKCDRISSVSSPNSKHLQLNLVRFYRC